MEAHAQIPQYAAALIAQIQPLQAAKSAKAAALTLINGATGKWLAATKECIILTLTAALTYARAAITQIQKDIGLRIQGVAAMMIMNILMTAPAEHAGTRIGQQTQTLSLDIMRLLLKEEYFMDAL